MVTILILLTTLFFILYIVGGWAMYIIVFDYILDIENPIWKLPLILFWPVGLIICGFICVKNYVVEVIEYYEDKL